MHNHEFVSAENKYFSVQLLKFEKIHHQAGKNYLVTQSSCI